MMVEMKGTGVRISRKEISSSRKKAADSDGGLRDTTIVTEVLAKAKGMGEIVP